MIKPVLLISGISLFICACNTDETPRKQVDIASFSLYNVGKFNFSDGNVLLIDSLDRNQIALQTDPGDAVVKFSRNKNAEFMPLKNLLEITPDIRQITFIAEKKDHRQSKPKSLQIRYLPGHYMKDFTISPNPVKDSLHLFVNNETRGTVGLTVFSLYGRKLLDKVLLKQRNELHFKRDISSYDPGVYVMLINMGSGKQSIKFIVQ